MTQLVPNPNPQAMKITLANPYNSVSVEAVGNEAIREMGKIIITSVMIGGFFYILGKAIERS